MKVQKWTYLMLVLIIQGQGVLVAADSSRLEMPELARLLGTSMTDVAKEFRLRPVGKKVVLYNFRKLQRCVDAQDVVRYKPIDLAILDDRQLVEVSVATQFILKCAENRSPILSEDDLRMIKAADVGFQGIGRMQEGVEQLRSERLATATLEEELLLHSTLT